MEEIHNLDTIDVELDEYFKRKQIFRCKDDFRNILCEEDNDDVNDGSQPKSNIEKSDKEYVEESDEENIDHDFEYSTHNPKVKWDLMKPMCGESVILVRICDSGLEKCPFVVKAS
ncbi:unnamed protein product [Lactuca saligna]|uniref:Uncharacterized protein n=1 Tax=Lactuca saligna TaxID=75948 RepID=A0AA35YFF5_LACSI|nr:unnamed protein product [Lactuca saligna]